MQSPSRSSPLGPRHLASTSVQTTTGASTEEARWRALFDTEPPRSASLVAQAIVWKEQALAQGDVAPAIARDLALVAGDLRAGRAAAPAASAADPTPVVAPSPDAVAGTLPPAASQLLPGTRLVKAYGGKTHVVEVAKGGMLYEGQLYASLSAVAKVITGTHWNGLLFFGLRKRKVYPAKVAADG